MFDPQHLEGASSDLVRSMFQVGRKAAELERQKLQTEIQKEKSELRRKKLEKRVKMAKQVKILKYMEMEPDDEEIEELPDEPVQGKKRKTMSLYSALGKDKFVTGSKDHKSRLAARQKRIAVAEKDKDDDDDEEETEEERLRRETVQLQSELQKTE